MRTLDKVTLVCIDTKQPAEAMLAMLKSMQNIAFAECKFLTRLDIKFPKLKDVNLEVIDIGNISNLARYNEFCLKELDNYIDTDYCLMVQHDGFVVRPELWTDSFLKYDYIGAPWPESWRYVNRVGNGGFSLRSKKFMKSCKSIFENFDMNSSLTRDRNDISINEDFLSCVIFYEDMLKLGIEYAPPELAALFSTEHPTKETLKESFGFHDKFTNFTSEVYLEKYINITL
jgi:hypothetical protein